MATLNPAQLGLGARPALLVVDATRGFTDPGSPLACSARMPLDGIAQLLARFRARGLPVVYTVNAYSNEQEARVFRDKLPVLEALAEGSIWTVIHPKVAPQWGETVLRKGKPSAFFDSPLRGWLADWAVDSVVVCGFSTSGGVRATAVDALQCELRVVVARDACGDRDAQAHAYNLRDLQLKTGDVMAVAEILKLPQLG